MDILLVEDNEDIQRVNKKMLERRSGYNVRLAMNLAEARKQINTAEPDLMVLDILLPDGNGLDFLKELRTQPHYIPVMLLSVLGKSSDIVNGLQAGADDYMAKPYENAVMLARIDSLLRRFRAAAAPLTRRCRENSANECVIK